MSHRLPSLAVALVGVAVTPALAGSGLRAFDGRWVADVPAQFVCSPSRVTLDVRGGTIAGNVVNSLGVTPIAGEIDPRGDGVLQIGGVGGVIRFERGRFVADYDNLRCGPRRAVGVRVG